MTKDRHGMTKDSGGAYVIDCAGENCKSSLNTGQTDSFEAFKVRRDYGWLAVMPGHDCDWDYYCPNCKDRVMRLAS